MDFVVTGFSDRSWNPWGASLLLSLRNIAKTEANVEVYDFGLSNRTRKKIDSLGIQVLQGERCGSIRSSTIEHVVGRAQSGENRFVYLDCDFWLQQSIDHVFDMIDDRIMICENLDHGLVGLSQCSSKKLNLVKKVFSMFSEKDGHGKLHQHFDGFFNKIPNKYNVMDLPSLDDSDGVLTYKSEPAVGIHPAGFMKYAICRRNLMFSERYQEMFDDCVRKNACIGHVILKNSDCK